MNALEIRGLGKRYRLGSRVPREIWALHDVTFDVAPGTILGVIGPNGAGKTTLLKIIGRVTRPTTGTVTGRGRVVPLLALGAGFQADLSGRENVFMNAAMYGVPAADVERNMDEIIEFSGIGDFIDVPVKRYSSGMYLRLAFSVAINMQPDILLADEVLAVGDLDFQERCLERVKDAGAAGMSVLFVSHDMEAIRRLCDRVVWLNAGEVAAIGPPDEVTTAYQNAAWSGTQASRKGTRQRGTVSAAGELVFVRLMIGGREIGAARVSDDVSVVIGIRTTQPDLRVRPQVDIKAQGVLAFRSTTEPVHVERPGFVTATVTIPPHVLADISYSVDVAVGIRRGEESFPVVLYNAATFNVYDPNEAESARGSFRGQMSGVVRPRLAWTVVPGEAGL
jgi:ABC-type polysaccharide/polyol phosphate transport system ATPase subunit